MAKRKLRRRAGDIIFEGKQAYKVLRVLGVGGMAQTYEVQSLAAKRRFALKEPHPEFVDRKELFEPEARVLGILDHPGIVKGVAIGRSDDGVPFFLMELLRGVTLRDAIRQGKLHLYDALWIMSQTFYALNHAHAAGVVHRDVKPENIFLNDEPGSLPIVKILDFGVVKLMSADAETGRFAGTLIYSSPEQRLGLPIIDAKADVYSGAVVFFEIATGTTPYRKLGFGGAYPDMLAAVDIPAPSLDEFGDYPPRVVKLIARALGREPKDRPETEEMAEVLRDVFKTMPIPSEMILTRDIVAGHLVYQEPITEGVFDSATIPDVDLPARMREISGPPSSDEAKPAVDRNAATKTAAPVPKKVFPNGHGPNGTLSSFEPVSMPVRRKSATGNVAQKEELDDLDDDLTDSEFERELQEYERAQAAPASGVVPTLPSVMVESDPALREREALRQNKTVRMIEQFDPKRTQRLPPGWTPPPAPAYLVPEPRLEAAKPAPPPEAIPLKFKIGVVILLLIIAIASFYIAQAIARARERRVVPTQTSAARLAPAPRMAQAVVFSALSVQRCPSC